MKTFSVRAFLFFLTISLCACRKPADPWRQKGSSYLSKEWSLIDFSKDFYSASDIATLKQKYPFFFPLSIPDSIWRAKKHDGFERALFAETQRVFADRGQLKADLNALFKRVKYFFPEITPPNVYTYVSKIDYLYPALYEKEGLFIGLDNFLGKDCSFYKSVPQYILPGMQPRGYLTETVRAIASKNVPYSPDAGDFLDEMLYQGKVMLMVDAILPDFSDEEKMGYTSEQLRWSVENQGYIWTYFIENQLIFSKEKKLYERFIAPGPFSKFYTEMDRSSPGRLGVWVGWQIMRSYWRAHPEKTLREILKNPDNKEIFAASHYKPQRQ